MCFLLSIPQIVLASNQTDAASEIQSAKTQLTNSYQLALEAEQSGANITDLTATLNNAGSLLSQAENLYSIGDFASSQNLAVQSQVQLDGFTAKANLLKEDANAQRSENFLSKIIEPILGSTAVIIVGIAVWFTLKKKYGDSGTNTRESSTHFRSKCYDFANSNIVQFDYPYDPNTLKEILIN